MTPKREAPPAYSTAAVRVVRLPGGEEVDDRVAVEEPLELRIGGQPVAVTMRTPGHDEELALGFALSEGLRPLSARLPDDLAANTIELEAPGFDPARIARSFYTTSSCGVCGKGALEAIAVESPPVESALTISGALVGTLPDRLREAQAAFDSTGGLHATGLFTAAGELVCAREDVGRHNAMDKVIGRAFLDGLLPLADHVLCVSGRLSFELVQKAAVAGCPVVVAVGAPSSLAVELAADRGVTLCGFVRDGRCNVYSRPERITRLSDVARGRCSPATSSRARARIDSGSRSGQTRPIVLRRRRRDERNRAHPRRHVEHVEPRVGHHARPVAVADVGEHRRDRVRLDRRPRLGAGLVEDAVDDPAVLHVAGQEAERKLRGLGPGHLVAAGERPARPGQQHVVLLVERRACGRP